MLIYPVNLSVADTEPASTYKEIMAQFNVTVCKQNERGVTKWVVNIYSPGKKRQRIFCNTKEQAESEAEAKRVEFESAGLAAMGLSPRQRIEALDAFQRASRLNISLSHALDFYERQRKSAAISMLDLYEAFIESRKRVRCSEKYLDNIGRVLTQFLSADPKRELPDYTADYIEKWLHGLDISPSGFNTYRAYINSFFEMATRKHFIDVNPVTAIETMQLTQDKVSILAPDQMRRLLVAARAPGNEDILACIAIGGFAGLRPESEAERLTWENIDLHVSNDADDFGRIDVSAENKTAQNRFVKILPALAKVLASINRPKGAIIQPNFRRRYDAVVDAAGVTWSTDILRHSYASYHVAYFEDVQAVARQMGHSTTKTVYKHYIQRVKRSEAVSWWEI